MTEEDAPVVAEAAEEAVPVERRPACLEQVMMSAPSKRSLHDVALAHDHLLRRGDEDGHAPEGAVRGVLEPRVVDLAEAVRAGVMKSTKCGPTRPSRASAGRACVRLEANLLQGGEDAIDVATAEKDVEVLGVARDPSEVLGASGAAHDERDLRPYEHAQFVETARDGLDPCVEKVLSGSCVREEWAAMWKAIASRMVPTRGLAGERALLRVSA